MNVFVFRPTGLAGEWKSLINQLSSVQGRKIIEFDDSIQSPCVIPASDSGAPWPMRDVTWAGFGPRTGSPRSVVRILNGTTFSDLRMIGGQITIENEAVDRSPISDFGDGLNHVQIGLRDDGGNPHLVNHGKAPLFDLADKQGLFFLQNCLFGISNKLAISSSPLVRVRGPGSLILNLLGLNQTGPNVVRGENGASVVFNAISAGAQVASDQSEAGGGLQFGGVGRIQRKILPLPPRPPATEPIGKAEGFNIPNVLLRFNGIREIIQVLPKIKGAPQVQDQESFSIGLTDTPLYTGGQEIIIAEVVGGRKLLIRAADGDSIDGYTGLVSIPGRSTRTLVSDGESTWITTSRGRPRPSIFPPFPLPLPSPDFDEFSF